MPPRTRRGGSNATLGLSDPSSEREKRQNSCYESMQHKPKQSVCTFVCKTFPASICTNSENNECSNFRTICRVEVALALLNDGALPYPPPACTSFADEELSKIAAAHVGSAVVNPTDFEILEAAPLEAICASCSRTVA